MVFFLTFFAYVLFHATRKPFAVCKNVLHGSKTNDTNSSSNHGWTPFNGENYMLHFSALDTVWASSYALSMFINGHVAEHLSFTYVLGSGLICSGLFCIAFGAAKIWEIHNFAYYVFIMVGSGFFQSSGWPCLVAIMSYWFEGSKQGAIFGIWSSHASIGNIIGQAVAAKFVVTDWSLSFIIPGVVAAIYGVLLIFFLIQSNHESTSFIILKYKRHNYKIIILLDPKNIGFGQMDTISINDSSTVERTELENAHETTLPLLIEEDAVNSNPTNDRPLGFIKAFMLPGVIEYSMCLFFAKMVVYTFLFWLPFYIKKIGIKGYVVTSENAGYLSLLFDVGGIIGGFCAGLLADVVKRSGICCFVFQILGAIALYVYSIFGSESYYIAVTLLVVSGFFVNGPTTLISTAVASGIASNPNLQGRGAKGTVAGIIDGMGSLGSAVSPFVIQVVSKYGWEKIMITMMVSLLLSALFTLRQVLNELAQIFRSI